MSLRLPPEEYAALCSTMLKRDGYRCRHCWFRQTLAIHHIVFRSQGGPDSSWNLCTLCTSCHAAVHANKLDIWSDDQRIGADGYLKFTTAPGWKPE